MALPMPEPTNSPLPLLQYKVLSFDVYGTLIKYKSDILDAFQPLISRLPASSPYHDKTPLSPDIPDSATVGSIEFLKLFQKEEDKIKLETPVPRFDIILQEIWRRIAQALDVETSDDEIRNFGSASTISDWRTFSGTVDALHKLSEQYKLVALSNINKYTWSITGPSSGLGDVKWWKVFTAEDFGSDATKADEAKLETLIEYAARNGIAKHEILHVAQSLGHDHAPAKRLGLSSVFLTGDGPKWGKQAESKMAIEKNLVGYGWRCTTLAEFAHRVEAATRAKS